MKGDDWQRLSRTSLTGACVSCVDFMDIITGVIPFGEAVELSYTCISEESLAMLVSTKRWILRWHARANSLNIN